MNKQLDKILQHVAEETFESLAFLLPMPPPDEPIADCPTTVVTVGFHGPFSGKLIVILPEAVLGELTGNMLGLDDDTDIPVETQQDALKELANVVCGNVLPEIAGDTVVFNVAAPELIDASAPVSKEGLSTAATAGIFLDSGPASLELLTEGPIDAEAPLAAARE
jgi:CheY-specific phosphatase CheX